MAVYTEVPFSAAASLIDRLGLGELQALRGIHSGIENTNYFADTTSGRFVLTVFERLTAQQLPFYLHLMKHLADRGIPVPGPKADATGELLHALCGKPAAVVDRLPGHHHLAPDAAHCAALGAMLARMHLAGADFELRQPNLRGLAWWVETVPVVQPFLNAEQRLLLDTELTFQQHLAATPAYAALPCGAIHGDLFRDNVMFDVDVVGSANTHASADASADAVAEAVTDAVAHEPAATTDRLTGFFDFYFAGIDTFLFDLAVCLNDWGIDLDSGRLIEQRAAALTTAYDSVRPLDTNERRLLPALMRAAALRFWLSRLWDLHLPRDAALLTAHDPSHFERVLRACVEAPWHPAPPESATR